MTKKQLHRFKVEFADNYTQFAYSGEQNSTTYKQRWYQNSIQNTAKQPATILIYFSKLALQGISAIVKIILFLLKK